MDMCYDFAIFLVNKTVGAFKVGLGGYEIQPGAQDALF